MTIDNWPPNEGDLAGDQSHIIIEFGLIMSPRRRLQSIHTLIDKVLCSSRWEYLIMVSENDVCGAIFSCYEKVIFDTELENIRDIENKERTLFTSVTIIHSNTIKNEIESSVKFLESVKDDHCFSDDSSIDRNGDVNIVMGIQSTKNYETPIFVDGVGDQQGYKTTSCKSYLDNEIESTNAFLDSVDEHVLFSDDISLQDGGFLKKPHCETVIKSNEQSFIIGFNPECIAPTDYLMHNHQVKIASTLLHASNTAVSKINMMDHINNPVSKLAYLENAHPRKFTPSEAKKNSDAIQDQQLKIEQEKFLKDRRDNMEWIFDLHIGKFENEEDYLKFLATKYPAAVDIFPILSRFKKDTVKKIFSRFPTEPDTEYKKKFERIFHPETVHGRMIEKKKYKMDELFGQAFCSSKKTMWSEHRAWLEKGNCQLMPIGSYKFFNGYYVVGFEDFYYHSIDEDGNVTEKWSQIMHFGDFPERMSYHSWYDRLIVPHQFDFSGKMNTCLDHSLVSEHTILEKKNTEDTEIDKKHCKKKRKHKRKRKKLKKKIDSMESSLYNSSDEEIRLSVKTK
jgi:hypothetical protein